MNPFLSKLFGVALARRLFDNPRRPKPGEGKHYQGTTESPNARRKLLAKRKAERQHRRRVMLQSKGRKHHV